MKFNLELCFFLVLVSIVSIQCNKKCTHYKQVQKIESTSLQNGTEKNSLVKHQIVKRRARRIFVLCFKTDKGTDIVKKSTAEECVSHCWNLEKNLAFIKEGSLCRCLDNMNQATYTAMSGCRTPCEGDPNQNCGGDGKYAMYKTGFAKEPSYTTMTEYTPKFLQKAYKGCFEKSGETDKKLRLEFSRMTTSMCNGYCQDSMFNFAAVSSGTTCTCLLALKHLRKTNEGKCRKECAGMQSMNCGGDNDDVVGVYKTPSGGAFSETDFRERPRPNWAGPPQKSYDYFKGSNKNNNQRSGRRKRKRNRKKKKKKEERKMVRKQEKKQEKKKQEKKQEKKKEEKKKAEKKKASHKKTTHKKPSHKHKKPEVKKKHKKSPKHKVKKIAKDDNADDVVEESSGTTVTYTTSLKVVTGFLVIAAIVS